MFGRLADRREQLDALSAAQVEHLSLLEARSHHDPNDQREGFHAFASWRRTTALSPRVSVVAVYVEAGVVAIPPIRGAGVERLALQPVAFGGVVIGTVGKGHAVQQMGRERIAMTMVMTMVVVMTTMVVAMFVMAMRTAMMMAVMMTEMEAGMKLQPLREPFNRPFNG